MKVKKPLFVAILFLALFAGSVQAAPLECGLDLFSLRVNQGNVTFFLKNIGVNATTVSFQTTIGDSVFSGNTTLAAGQIVSVGQNATFAVGSTPLSASAVSSCGATDHESITHIVLEQVSCFSPPAVAGQDRCELSTQSYFVCEGGSWVLRARNTNDYCYACGLSTCGDGVLNCGETAATCPRDARRMPCPRGYTGNYRCSGDILQQEYRDDSCRSQYVTSQQCTYGCENNACLSSPFPGSCGISLSDVTAPSGSDTITMAVKNTGVPGHIATVRFLKDGNLVQSVSAALFSGQELRRTFHYVPPAGQLTFQASASCGASDSVSVSAPVHTKPVSPPLPTPSLHTTFTSFPENLDLRHGDAGAVALTLTTARPQPFTITVSGIPADWVSVQSPVAVADTSVVYLTITGKEPGTYPVAISVFAQNEGKNLTADLNLFVASPPFLAFTGAFLFVTEEIIIIIVGGVIILFIIYAFREDIRYKTVEYRWRRLLTGQKIKRV